MKTRTLIRETPWDAAAFGMPTWELTEYTEDALAQIAQVSGHYTIKVDPLANKQLLREYGFYYCDTLIEPHVTAARLRPADHPDASISETPDTGQILAINHGAYQHGRFHRDFNLPKSGADLRYDRWLQQLVDSGRVFELQWQGRTAGFIGNNDGCLVLHAIAPEHRGKGRAKYWWSAVCRKLLASGHSEVSSSISASNLPVLNLYASLGFQFTNPRDIYHLVVP
jgi:GNAT superfamily N-acetyltransferase